MSILFASPLSWCSSTVYYLKYFTVESGEPYQVRSSDQDNIKVTNPQIFWTFLYFKTM